MLGVRDIFSIKIVKYSVSDWESKKPKLLEMIDKSHSAWNECDTDYFTCNGRAPYFNEWYSLLENDFKEIKSKIPLPFKEPEEWQLWSQTYNKGDYHSLHNHGMGNMSAVLHVEFDPEEHTSTTFCCPFPDPFFGRLDNLSLTDVHEGDIILFPAMLGHECRVQRSDKPRKIMSFNIPIG
jgi:hypothetical protein